MTLDISTALVLAELAIHITSLHNTQVRLPELGLSWVGLALVECSSKVGPIEKQEALRDVQRKGKLLR